MNNCINLFFATGTAIFSGYSYKTMLNVEEATNRLNECMTRVASEAFEQTACDNLSQDLSSRNLEHYVALGVLTFLFVSGSVLCQKPVRQ